MVKKAGRGCKMMRYYDLILLDLNMPILSGDEACKKIIDFYINQTKDIL